MAEFAVLRYGPLSEEVVRAAVADELARGREAYSLRVGGERAYREALRILTPEGGLASLTQTLPRVHVDRDLREGQWRLFTFDETVAAMR